MLIGEMNVSDAICLDDSDGGSSIVGDDIDELMRKCRAIETNYDNDYDFPPVDFHYDVVASTAAEQIYPSHNEVIISHATCPSSTERCHISRKKKQFNANKLIEKTIIDKSKASKKKNIVKSVKIDEEKIEAKKNAARERIVKKIAQKKLKNIQPGECMKFIHVNINDCIETNFDFYHETVVMLESACVTYSTSSSLVIPNNCVTWTRIIEEYSIGDDNKLNTTVKKIREKYALIIWKWDEVIKLIHDEKFTASVASIVDAMPEIKFTLVIYGIEHYFENCKRNTNRKNNKSYDDNEMINIPKISRKNFELSLIDIQLDVNINTRLIENSSDMSLLIYQYTKAIAEKTYKLETRDRLHDQMEFFAAGDNKKTVKVDNDGYGLKKLWLKQLCMFNTTSLATADAICSIYSSPDELINAYINCSSVEDGDQLLQSIQIKRAAAGPLAKVRKLGPELSRKIHTMFTSTNGEQLLS